MSKRLEQYFYLVLGSTLLTLGIWLFVTPNQINFGGMIGLAQLIDYFIHKFLVLPKSLNTLGMINLLMNIPLFIFGYKIMNKEFCFKTIISLIIFLGIPSIFLVLCIINVIKIVKAKKNKESVNKSLIIKSIIFGLIFILIIIFYAWVMYSLSRAVANM